MVSPAVQQSSSGIAQDCKVNVDIAKLCQTGWDSSYLGRAHARQRRLTADIRNAVSDRASTLHCPISL